MNNIYKLLLIVLLVTSCEGFSILERDQKNIFFSENIVDSPVYNGNLKVATFNMKLGFCQNCNPFSGDLGGDHEHLDKIVDLIQNMNLDIVGFQEVGYNYDTSIVENQIQYIAEQVQMNYAYGMGRALQTGNNLFLRGYIGNAVLSKYEILNVENPTIRYIDYYNQNHALKTKIKLRNQKEVIVLSTHLESGSTNDEKTIQINKLLQQTESITTPVIIAGDFNISYIPNSSFLSLLNNNFSNTLEAIPPPEQSLILNTGTFITGSTIDFIYVSKNDFTIESVYLVPEEYRNISDHFMYVSDIKIIN